MSNYYATQRPDRGYQFYGSFEGLTEAMAHFGITPNTPDEVHWWSDEDCGDGPGWGPKPEWAYLGDSNLGEGTISVEPLQDDPRKFVALEAPGLETYPSLQAADEMREFVRRILAALAPASEDSGEDAQGAERPRN